MQGDAHDETIGPNALNATALSGLLAAVPSLAPLQSPAVEMVKAIHPVTTGGNSDLMAIGGTRSPAAVRRVESAPAVFTSRFVVPPHLGADAFASGFTAQRRH